MKGSLGVDQTERIRSIFAGRLPGFTDLVCYWFEKSREAVVLGNAKRVGLVATNSIAKNTNLPVMRRITKDLTIYEAHSDEAWVVDGAAVRVSIILFGHKSADGIQKLNGVRVANINANLTSGIDVSAAKIQPENIGRSMLGIQKSGPFDVDGELARAWMRLPLNPNGLPNSSVLKPYRNGDDLMSNCRDKWLIDLPRGLNEAEASLFEAPFKYLSETLYDAQNPNLGTLKDVRSGARDQHARLRWWEPYWPRPEMRRQIQKVPRYIVTPETAEHRLFVWMSYPTLPDKNLIVIPRDDDSIFGILQSRIHECWVTVMGNRMGKGNQRRYNNSTCFETFPFPEDFLSSSENSNAFAHTIQLSAQRLNELRESWLTPSDLVKLVDEHTPDFPRRILPTNEEAADILNKRTLTNLYNDRPAWLEHAHRELDRAVAAAYGWQDDFDNGVLTDDEILKRLFELNQTRAKSEEQTAG
jgi:hypothetical protein